MQKPCNLHIQHLEEKLDVKSKYDFVIYFTKDGKVHQCLRGQINRLFCYVCNS